MNIIAKIKAWINGPSTAVHRQGKCEYFSTLMLADFPPKDAALTMCPEDALVQMQGKSYCPYHALKMAIRAIEESKSVSRREKILRIAQEYQGVDMKPIDVLMAFGKYYTEKKPIARDCHAPYRP